MGLVCGSCFVQNPAGQKFCGECGSSLALTCPACGAPVTVGQKLCGDCGAKIHEAATAASGPVDATPPAVRDAADSGSGPVGRVAERRVCSVLFADLVGFTPLSESRDPEEVRELLTAYFDSARTVIGRYAGVVEKFIGDAVMAVWGTPIAGEDDAERAVRAGLELIGAVAVFPTPPSPHHRITASPHHR